MLIGIDQLTIENPPTARRSRGCHADVQSWPQWASLARPSWSVAGLAYDAPARPRSKDAARATDVFVLEDCSLFERNQYVDDPRTRLATKLQHVAGISGAYLRRTFQSGWLSNKESDCPKRRMSVRRLTPSRGSRRTFRRYVRRRPRTYSGQYLGCRRGSSTPSTR